MYDKFINKNRLLVIYTPSYKNEKYKLAKEKYEDNIKEFHKRFIKLIVNVNKNNKFEIHLIGFDGTVKKKYKTINKKDIFTLVDNMPMSKLNINPKNLSLYSDYNKETTIQGLGFKNKEKALYTIDKIKSKPKNYQMNVINTMIGRAKNHPHQTKEMKEAIVIFTKWKNKKLINYNNVK